MKKEKKEKGPKKKWSVFKTIVVVFASFIFVVGVVLGGIYLAGGLRKKHTAPQSIQLELCSDADLYDPIKARYNSGTGQIEATADFWLVVTSPTAEITEDIIELTLSDNKGGNNSEIRNDSIRVPRYVTIGVPFKVTALTAPLKNSDGQADRLGLSYDEEGYILKEEGKPDKVEMIKGGISTLTATSTAVRVNPPSTNIKIAVDTPVYKVGTILTTIGGEELTIDENIYQITQNDKFKADMIFFPEKSEYMFGETKEMENPRTKLSFFQTKGKIDMNIGSDGVTFVGTELSSDTTAEAIDGYAFESASDQVELFLTSFKRDWQDEAFLRLVDEYCVSKNFSVFNGVDTIITSEDRFYTTMLSAFPSENKASCTDSARVDVVEATVDNFEVDFRGFGSDADDYMKTNSDYTLYVNGEHNPDENKLSLMAQAFAKNVPITNLLANVAIRFKYFAGEWQDVDLNQPNAQISVRGGETVVVDGKTYLCPNTDVADLNYAYYTIHTTSNFSFQMEVVLIIHGKNGENTIFKNSATTYEFIAKPAPETDNVYWTISDLTMQLSGEGDVFSSPVNLEQYSVAPSGQTKVYFAYFGDEAGNAKFNADRIIGANAYEENRVGTYGGLYLFPLVNHNLIAISAGQFDLYFATIRTTSDGHTPEYDDGLYSINKITSEPIKVKALRSLYSESVGNLNAYISPTNDLVSDDSNIYVYNGSNVGLHLEFTIKEDSRDVFATELKNGNIRLRILNSLGEDISTYFSGSELTTDLNGVSLVYNLTFVGLGRGVSEVTIGDAKLEFEELSWSKLIKHQDTKNIVLYTPTPEKIEVQLTGIEDTVPVPVEQTLSPEGVFETSIGDMEIGGTILDWINQHITITVTDNKDNQKVFENSWRFETSDAKALMISADGHSFTFGTVEGSATLSVSCGTATRKTVVTFEISATGLTELDYSTSDQIDDDLTTNPDAKRTVSDDLSQVTVNKYGEAGKTITLANLIELRSGETKINNVTGFLFRLSPSWLHSSALNDDALYDLLGEGGMLTLVDASGDINVEDMDASALRTNLEGKTITKVKINLDFGSKTQAYQSLQFEIVDKKLNYTINISFTLNLLANKTISTDAESDVTAYAQVETVPSGKIMTQNVEGDTIQNKVASLYASYYIADTNDDSIYELVTASENAVGVVTADGKFKFYDIWTKEDKVFVVRFSLESAKPNTHTLTHEITFTIQRNLKITQTQEGEENKRYKIFGGEENINAYFTLERKGGSSPITLDDAEIAISTDGEYIEVINGGYNGGFEGQLHIKTAPLFKKSEPVLQQNIFFTIDGQDLGSFVLQYELGIENEDFAKSFTYSEDTPISTQLLNGVTHLLFENNMTYSYKKASPDYSYRITTSQRGYTAGGSYVLNGDSNINFSNDSANYLISGINEDRYLIVEFYKDEGMPLAYSLVPILVSSVGTNFVKYTESVAGFTEQSQNLNTALLDAEALIDAGLYEEVNGGNAISLDANEGFGFYNTSNFEINATSQYSVLGELISGTEIVKAINGSQIYINHLEGDTYPNGIYLLVTMHIYNGGKSIDFNYLLKIKPSVTTSVQHPYDNEEEHLQPINDNGDFEAYLDREFDETALNSGESRFDITVDDLKYTYMVESINDLSEEDMAESLTVTWGRADDNDAHYSKMSVRLKDPNDNTVYRIKVRRVYNGGEGNTEYAVFGDNKTYTFVINAIQNYVIQYGNNANKSPENPNNATWVVNPTGGGKQTLNVPLYLSDSMTSIPANKLKFFVNSKDLAKLGWTTDNVKYGEEVTSEGISLSGGVLAIIRPNYVEQDTNVRVYFYTEFGLTGTLTVTLKSSITYTQRENKNYNEGAYSFSDFVTQLNKDNSAYTNYDITEAHQTTYPYSSKKDIFVYTAGDVQPFKIYPTTQDYEIGISIKIQDRTERDKTTTFNLTINVLKGITPEQEVNHSESVNTGRFTVDKTRLYRENAFTTSPTMKFTWRNESGDYLDEQATKQDSINITADAVNADVPVTAIITVYLYTNGNVGEDYYESFEVKYHVTLTPSTRIAVTYPDPTNVGDKSQVVQAEYLEDGYTMSKGSKATPLDTFFTGYPDFVGETSENKRLYFTDLTNGLRNGDFSGYHSGDYTKSVSIYSMQNITLTTDNKKTFNEQSGDIYQQMTGVNTLTLSMGDNDLLESFVVFQIECNGAVAQYKVILQKHVYEMNLNYAQTDVNGNEVFYVENLNQTGATKIFAENRLLKFRLNIIEYVQNIIAGDFRWVLQETATKQYKALDLRPQRFKTSDAGKQFIFDLGTSYAGYEYVGTYYKDSETVKNILASTPVEDAQVRNEKLDNNLYAEGQKPTLCQRVELYALQGNNRVLVNPNNYALKVKTTESGTYSDNVEISARSQDDLDNTQTFYGFEFAKQGTKSLNQNLQFENQYKYVLKLDIAIGSSGLNSVQEIIAGDEKDPSRQAILTQRNQITHPSTGFLLTEEELLDEKSNAEILLEIVGIDEAWNDGTPDGNTKADGGVITLADYKEKYPGINIPYNGNKDYRYLSLATRESGGSAGKITNFLITGRGAPAGGAYVLLKFTYKVKVNANTLEKSAYLVYKVLPGYMITLQSSTYDASQTAEGEIISNEGAEALYSTSTEQYGQIVIAGNSTIDAKAIVKVTLRNQPQDIAVSNFKYTMRLDDSKDSRRYNVKNNISQKFNPTISNFTSPWEMWNGGSKVTDFESAFTEFRYNNPRDNGLIQFSNVIAVAISDQYYYLEAEDDYGFKFQVYFTLVAKNQSPSSASGTINITENDPFDVFAQYSILSIEELPGTTSLPDDLGHTITTTPIQVNSTPATILSSDTYKYFIIDGVNAWGFSTNVAGGKSVDNYLEVEDGKYVGKTIGDEETDRTVYTLGSGDSEGMRELTFSNLDFYKIAIAQIDLQTKDGENINSINVIGDDTDYPNKRLATSGNLTYNSYNSFDEDNWLRENESLEEDRENSYNNAYNDAIFFSAKTKDVEGQPISRFTMPEINASYYHGRNSVPLNMVITLRYYTDVTPERLEYTGVRYEEFTVSYDINLSKNATYDPIGMVVRDGEKFNIEDAIMSGFKNGDKDGESTYYNDTLEVTLPADSGEVTVTISYEADSKETTLRNPSSYPKTQYISISNVIGKTVNPGETFTVKVDAGDSVSGLKRLGVNESADNDYYGAYVLYRTSRSTGESLYEMYYKKDADGINLYSNSSSGSESKCENMNVTIGQIVTDQINFISAEEMPIIGQVQFVTKTKYYVAKTTKAGDGEKGPYEVARQYAVVPYYSRLSKNYSAFKLVDKYFKNGLKYKVPVQGWTEGMTLDIIGKPFDSYTIYEWDSFNENAVRSGGGPIYFETNNAETAGAVTVDPNTGVIETTNKFNIQSQHAIIDVYINASGLKGDFKTASTASPRKLLSSVEFQLKNEGISFASAGSTMTLQNIGYTNGELGFITETVSGLSGFEGTLVTPMLVDGMNVEGLDNVTYDRDIKIIGNKGKSLYRINPDGETFAKINRTVSTAQNRNWKLDELNQDRTIVAREGDNTYFYIPYDRQTIGNQEIQTYVRLKIQMTLTFDNSAKIYKLVDGRYEEVEGKQFSDLGVGGNSVKINLVERPNSITYIEITTDAPIEEESEETTYYLNRNEAGSVDYQSKDDNDSAKIVSFVKNADNISISGTNIGNGFSLYSNYYSIASAFGYKRG